MLREHTQDHRGDKQCVASSKEKDEAWASPTRKHARVLRYWLRLLPQLQLHFRLKGDRFRAHSPQDVGTWEQHIAVLYITSYPEPT